MNTFVNSLQTIKLLIPKGILIAFIMLSAVYSEAQQQGPFRITLTNNGVGGGPSASPAAILAYDFYSPSCPGGKDAKIVITDVHACGNGQTPYYSVNTPLSGMYSGNSGVMGNVTTITHISEGTFTYNLNQCEAGNNPGATAVYNFITSTATVNAGPDQSTSTGTASMNGVSNYQFNNNGIAVPVTGTTFKWSVVTGGGTFTNSNAAMSAVTGIPTGINTYRLTLSSSCGVIDTDDVIVVAFPPVTPFAMTSVCNTVLTLPTLPVVTGFTIKYSVDGGAFTATPVPPSSIGCHTFVGEYLTSAVHGTIAAGTASVTTTLGATIFPAAPTLTASSNTCGTMFTLPTATAVSGFSVQYSIDSGPYSLSPSTTAPGCHTVKAQYILSADCGNLLAGTVAPCSSSPVSIVIFPTAPTITAPATVCEGSSFVLPPVTAVGGFSVQYSVDGGTSFSASPGIPTAAGAYSVVARYIITSACGSTAANATGSCGNSNTVIATVNTKVGIATQPAATTAICPGSTFNLSVTPSGTGPYSYQWNKNGTAITGATGQTFSITNISSGDAANYKVTVSGICGTPITSTTAALIVNTNVGISTQPITSATLCPGGAFDLFVTPSGTAPFSYQWYKGAASIVGATAATFSIPNVSASDANNNYTVTVTGLCGTPVTSTNSTLTVNDNVGISTQPVASTSLCVGGTFNLSVSANGTGPFTYQWNKNGTNITEATAATFSIASVSSSDGAAYSVKVSGACGTPVLSTNASLIINIPTISGNPDVTVTMNAQLTGSGAPAVTNPWVSSDVSIATIDNNGKVTGVSAGSATITYTNSLGCTATTTTHVTVLPLPTVSGTTTILVGNSSQFTGSGTPASSNPWVSGNPAIATVDNNGKVTAVSSGTTTISYTNSTGQTKTVTVTVPPLPVINGNPMVPEGRTSMLTGSGTPSTTNPWASSNPAIATIDNNGNVTAISPGSSTVTYTDSFGQTKTVTVIVPPLPTISGVTTVQVGATSPLIGSGKPSDTNPWMSSDPGVATVDNNGNVKGVSTGSTTITYIDSFGQSKTITVNVPMPAIKGNPVIVIGTPGKVTGPGIPSPTDPWTSSNPGVATVDPNGNVVGIAPGTDTLTYKDDHGNIEIIIITVKPAPAIPPVISGNPPTLVVGTTVGLTGSGTPSKTDPWESSDPKIAIVDSLGNVTAVGAGTAAITYTNSDGEKITVTITVLPNNFIPGGFSPRTKDNINDTFVITPPHPTDNVSLSVYNRWGSLVYQNSTYDNSWGGVANRGVEMGEGIVPSGTYFCVVELSGQDNKKMIQFITIP